MRLLIQEADRPPREIEAIDGLTIGRGPTNMCALADDAASSAHARIVSDGGRLAIEDVGSSNGTWIEGGPRLERGVPRPLEVTLRLLIGRTSIEVLGPARAPAAAPSGDPTISPDVPLPAWRRVRAAPDATLPPQSDEVPTLPGAPVGRSGWPDPATVQPEPPRVVPMPAPSTAAPKAKPPAKRAAGSPSAPEPVPAPQRAAGRGPTPAPAGASSSDPLTVGGTLVPGGGDMDEAAIQVRLTALKPRLVFVSHKVGRAKSIREPKTEIGRREGGPVGIGLEDEGVSSRHAKISFDGYALYVEDLGSSNGTWVGETKVAPRSGPKEVRCDERIRVGTVDVLVLLDSLTGAEQATSELYTDALANLQRDPAVSQEKVREATRQLRARKHPGEYLVVENAISVAQWCDAVDAARLRRKLNDQGGGGSKTVYWVLAIVLLAAVGGYFGLKLLR